MNEISTESIANTAGSTDTNASNSTSDGGQAFALLLSNMQIGFGVVSVYDIQNNSQVPVVGNLLNLVLLILFYGVNGHLKVIAIIYSTIEKVPIGHAGRFKSARYAHQPCATKD